MAPPNWYHNKTYVSIRFLTSSSQIITVPFSKAAAAKWDLLATATAITGTWPVVKFVHKEPSSPDRICYKKYKRRQAFFNCGLLSNQIMCNCVLRTFFPKLWIQLTFQYMYKLHTCKSSIKTFYTFLICTIHLLFLFISLFDFKVQVRILLI